MQYSSNDIVPDSQPDNLDSYSDDRAQGDEERSHQVHASDVEEQLEDEANVKAMKHLLLSSPFPTPSKKPAKHIRRDEDAGDPSATTSASDPMPAWEVAFHSAVAVASEAAEVVLLSPRSIRRELIEERFATIKRFIQHVTDQYERQAEPAYSLYQVMPDVISKERQEEIEEHVKKSLGA